MIKSKRFESETALNGFVNSKNISIISIETISEEYNTGLPMSTGDSFITTTQVIKLWYKENFLITKTT
jgi:hypothetical protein